MGSSRRWTDEEYEYLRETWGIKPVPSIAKHLGRSVNAIHIKVARLGLGPYTEAGTMISLYSLLRDLGKTAGYNYLKTKLESDGLPIKYKRVNECRVAMVNIDAFWKWAETHKTYFDLSQLEKNALGAEPDWVADARKAAYRSRTIRTPWTKDEDSRLRDLLCRYKYTYNDLRELLGRSEGAIKRRITTLGIKERPLRHEVKKWSDKEVDMLIKMHDDGYGFDAIGKVLGRSGLAVRGKFEVMRHEEYNRKVAENEYR